MWDSGFRDHHTETRAGVDTVQWVTWNSVEQGAHVQVMDGWCTVHVLDSGELGAEQQWGRMGRIGPFLPGWPPAAVGGLVANNDELGSPVKLAVFCSPCELKS